MSRPSKPLTDYPESLVRSWLEVELCTPGRLRADALRDLNEDFGMAVRHDRLIDWLTGKYSPPREVRRFMAQCAVQHVLRDEGVVGLEDEQLDRIANRLS